MDLLLAALLISAPSADREPFNVVIIITDDQGPGDLGFTGNPIVETPHLDALAEASARLTRFYVSPVCSPTRASLMTGRWNYRTGVVDTWVGRSNMYGDEVTLAEVLRDAGYATGIFGKWHLGDVAPLRPMDQGFEASLVHYGGGLAQPSEPPENERRYTDPILVRQGEEVPTQGYCTDVYYDEALEFVDQCHDADRPFFLYLPTNAPHGPFHDVPENLYEKYKAKDLAKVVHQQRQIDNTARIFAMVENVDQNVGRLMAKLDSLDLTKRTLVLFMLDNGPNGDRYNLGLRGRKTHVYEGGIRSVFFAHLPGTLPAGEDARIGAHVDVFPTILDLVGVPVPNEVELDGVSLLPLLDGSRPDSWPERLLFLQIHRGNTPQQGLHAAVVGSRMKLVRNSGFGGLQSPTAQSATWELFDLIVDPGETRDLAGEHPEVAAAMRLAYEKWFEDVSTSRPQGFAPPRLHVGSPVQRSVRLTKQDWRQPDEKFQGWGQIGTWPLEVIEGGAFEARVFRRELVAGTLTLDFGQQRFESLVNDTDRWVSVGEVSLEPGVQDLRVSVVDAHGAETGIDQVILTRK